jgi:acetyl-CoA carboxylase biotin carboxylase subunit
MNTRIQVEHPVTEMITGVDLVKLQIEVAQGKPLPFTQKEITRNGHALECRIYAEDPFHNFMPSPGLVVDQQYPHGPGVRLDNGIYAGFEIPLDYDPVLSKLITHGATRDEAIARMARALSEYRVSGMKTNLYFHRKAIAHPVFAKGNYSTRFIDDHLAEMLKPEPAEATLALAAAAVAKALGEKQIKVLTETRASETSVSSWRRLGKINGYR